MRILITGDRGVGKSTLVDRVCESLSILPAGLKTFPLVQNGIRVGYFLQDLQSLEKQLFAHREFEKKDRFAEFGIRKAVFEEFGFSVLKRLQANDGWILLDEIGVMEMECPQFLQAAQNLWLSSRNQIWVIQKRSPFLKIVINLKTPDMYCVVSQKNRNRMIDEIVFHLKRVDLK